MNCTQDPSKGLDRDCRRATRLSVVLTTIVLASACSGVDGGSSGTNPSGYTSGLAVTNAIDLNATGPTGGPFDPSGSYTITNQGTQALQWSATGSESWILLSSTFGFLQAGESVIVTASAGGATANALFPGSYAGTITFRDMADSSADIVRSVSLTVEDSVSSGLSVTPQSGFSASGEEGGPFTPSSMVYSVTNTNTTDVTWDVSLSDTFVFVVGASTGVLSPGQSVDVAIELDPVITDALSLGLYQATATFTNTGTGEIAATRSISLNVLSTVQGWTNFTPSVDTRIIYVSSTGSDSNDGLSESTPKRTIQAGLALLRDGFPDWLLLRRGDVFTTAVSLRDKSGRSASEPMLFGTYGPESDPRPQIRSGASDGIALRGNCDYFAVVGLHINAHTRTGTEGAFGVRWAAGGVAGLLEDCYIENYNINVVLWAEGFVTGWTMRRCIVVDAFAVEPAHSQGMFITDEQGVPGIDGVLIEECLFDHNGWREGLSGGNQTTFNHGLYIQPGIRNVTLRGNIIANSSANGAQARGGGIIDRNIFVRNPIALDWGMVTGGSNPVTGGVTGQITGNVILEGNDIDTNPRGAALNVANVASGLIADNLIANYASAQPWGSAMVFTGDINNEVDYGVRNIAVEDNLVYDWVQPLSWTQGSSGNEFQNVVVRRNNFQNPFLFASNTGRMLIHSTGSITTGFTYDANTYHTANPYSDWFNVALAGYSPPGWINLSGEANAVELSSVSAFANPNRDLRTYCDLIEATSGSSLNDCLAEIRQQRRGYWRPQYETLQILNYVREGFDLQPLQ